YNYNDAANGYYIYTMGNVTYSGVGHRVNAANNAAGSVPVGEAQLFINTMIAAHRSSTIKPLVTIRDKFGAESEFLYYSGGSGELMLDSDQSADMYASYFSFTVPNAPSGATHSAAFSYSYTVDGTPQAGTFTSALNGVATAAVTPTTTTAQNIYTFHVPRGVVEKLNAAAPPSVTVTVTVTTTVAEGGVTRTYYGEDSLELRKIGLIPLR
ncbi:MAG: hypothetical protein LBN99_04565, partial [Oscillospiraceae bacterium]|nr:hypothetical protein [Oscillospiraceae bacterium]